MGIKVRMLRIHVLGLEVCHHFIHSYLNRGRRFLAHDIVITVSWKRNEELLEDLLPVLSFGRRGKGVNTRGLMN